MRHLLAGVGSLFLLTACSGTGTGASTAAAPPPAAPDRVDAVAAEETDRCSHPGGFSVAHPADWSVNPGEVLPACSWFAAEPFAVPEASDVRTADIAFSVRPRTEVPTEWPDETARTRVDVADRTAVRVEQTTGPGFYPAGTRITTYVVDLGEAGEGPVLVADAVGRPGTDHDRQVRVLDAMMASLVLDHAGRV